MTIYIHTIQNITLFTLNPIPVNPYPSEQKPNRKHTGCPIISVPTFSVYKMVILWAFWSEILVLEISIIYILITTSGFSNISIKKFIFGHLFSNWNLAILRLSKAYFVYLAWPKCLLWAYLMIEGPTQSAHYWTTLLEMKLFLGL